MKNNFFKEMSTLPCVTAFICSDNIGYSDEDGVMYMEVIPDDIRDIVSKSIDRVPDVGGPIDNACGFETLHDAIIDSESIGTRLMDHVKPQNLLFVFSQSIESLYNIEIDSSFSPPRPHISKECKTSMAYEYGDGEEKSDTNNYAVILCKLKNTESVEQLIRAKEKNSCCDNERCYVSWGEMQKIKDAFCPVHSGEPLS